MCSFCKREHPSLLRLPEKRSPCWLDSFSRWWDQKSQHNKGESERQFLAPNVGILELGYTGEKHEVAQTIVDWNHNLDTGFISLGVPLPWRFVEIFLERNLATGGCSKAHQLNLRPHSFFVSSCPTSTLFYYFWKFRHKGLTIMPEHYSKTTAKKSIEWAVASFLFPRAFLTVAGKWFFFFRRGEPRHWKLFQFLFVANIEFYCGCIWCFWLDTFVAHS